jgi:hypothetical protein
MSELGEEEHAAVLEARKALIRSLERQFPPRHAGNLVCAAVAGFFADICAASSGRADLIEVINQQLRTAGLELRPVARN